MAKVAPTPTSVPWVEAYRPTQFDHIVLDTRNRTILQNIVARQCFPHLLLHGPPGTGKTTTAINLIRSFQTAECGKEVGDLVMHLNASDERGVDMVRNHICAFVQSKELFQRGTKFVVLDEADYMTKNAQQALRSLLQSISAGQKVRFCLICNYVSKIDEGLQNEFVKLRFNQLPPAEIVQFLVRIVQQEKLNVPPPLLQQIQYKFHSDIRSMVNFLQSNQHALRNLDHPQILCDADWNKFVLLMQAPRGRWKLSTLLNKWYQAFCHLCKEHAIDHQDALKLWLAFLLRTLPERFLVPPFLQKMEWVVHAPLPQPEYAVRYVLLQVHQRL